MSSCSAKNCLRQIILKYFLIFGVLQCHVMADWLTDNCKFAEDSFERTMANDLHFSKGLCDEEYEDCYNAATDYLAKETCNEPHNICLSSLVDLYEDAAKDSELLTKLFIEAIGRFDAEDCIGLCKFQVVFQKLIDENIFCG